MTRIIQRCFVVLAFTGVLLSTAQETTVSEVSDTTSQSNKTSTSAPQTSFNTTETSSIYSSSNKKDVNNAAAAESSSQSVAATDIIQTSSKVPITISESNADDFTTMSGNTAGNSHDAAGEKTSQNASHPGVLKAELKDDSSVTEAFSVQSNSPDSTSNVHTEEKKQSKSTSEIKTEVATEAAVKKPDYETSAGYVSNYSRQSSVPSEEELVYNSSYVDKNQSPEDMTSNAPSKVQSEESESNDTKSATHKRSLNATNSIVTSTAVMSSSEIISPASDSASLSSDSASSKPNEHEGEKHYSTILPSAQESDRHSGGNHSVVENGQFIGMKEDPLKPKAESLTSSINSDNHNGDNSEDVIMLFGSGSYPDLRSRIVLVPESSSSADLTEASLKPVSSDALSTLNEESIHPSESFDNTAQLANMRHTSTMSSIPLKSPDLEVEYEESVSNSNSPSSLVTFDPDGMTHNFTQDPDSITFSPKAIYGKSTNSYLSNLHSNKPELLTDNLSTAFVTEVVGSSNTERSRSSEREREIPPTGHGLLPHDEPDRELPASLHTFVSTNSPENLHSTKEPHTLKKSKTVLPVNNESEEMLNDSPQFIQNHNMPTVMPITGVINNHLNKHLENNISNDIAHISDLKSQGLKESHHELDFPIEYQTQQSEIRPVTEVSPIRSSDTVTDLPISHNVQSQSPTNQTKSTNIVSIPSDTSSTAILPNPAPSIVNTSLEKITVNISPEMLPKDYVPPELLPKDYVPPELLPKDYVTPKTQSTDHVSSEVLPKDHIPLEMLSKDYIPPEMLPKDYKPSEKPPEEPIKAEILPKDYVSPELLPKDYAPPEMLPKDYVPSETPPTDPVKPEILPKDKISPDLLPKDYVPPELLPKDYTPEQFEQENKDTNINTTIAGVAVKTSVSVSLPISKSSNNTTSGNSIKGVTNTSLKNIGVTSDVATLNKDADGNLSSAITTEIPTQLTTESRGFRIRKPKIKNNSGEDVVIPRTRKPFLPSLQKPSSTAGPPVSIFKQARTRLPSITSSTTQRPIPQFSTIRIHYASRIPGMVPGGEMVFSIEPITTTVPTTTETEEPFSEEPFTGQTVGPVVPTEDNVTLLKVAGMIVVDKGLRWNEQLNNRLSPQYKEREKFVQSQLYRLFRTSVIAQQLWKIQIDGFSGKRNSKSVVIDFFLYLIKTPNEVTPEQLVTIFHEKLINNTFSRFTVDTNKTSFEFLNEELMRTTTPPPEDEIQEPVIPQWAIAVIVVGAASLIFIVLFAAVAILGRHHVRRRYSNKLNDEDSDRPSDWESKMAAAYENLAADTIYDAEDFHSDTYKKQRYHNSTYNGRPSRPRRADSWSSSDWSPPPRRPRPQVHRIVY